MFGCTAPPQDFHWSTFSFSESRTTFSFAGQKKKWFYPQGVCPIRKAAKPPTAGLWPQLGRQKSDFPRKGHAPSVRRHSTHRAPAVSKRHSRQETACRHRPIRGPGRQIYEHKNPSPNSKPAPKPTPTPISPSPILSKREFLSISNQTGNFHTSKCNKVVHSRTHRPFFPLVVPPCTTRSLKISPFFAKMHHFFKKSPTFFHFPNFQFSYNSPSHLPYAAAHKKPHPGRPPGVRLSNEFR